MTQAYDYEARGRAIKAAKLARLLVLVVRDTVTANAQLEDPPDAATVLGGFRDAPDAIRARIAQEAGVKEPSALTWAMACDLAGDELGVPPEIT